MVSTIVSSIQVICKIRELNISNTKAQISTLEFLKTLFVGIYRVGSFNDPQEIKSLLSNYQFKPELASLDIIQGGIEKVKKAFEKQSCEVKSEQYKREAYRQAKDALLIKEG